MAADPGVGLSCPGCGYDLRGSRVDKRRYRCPECGWEGTSFQVRMARADRLRRRHEMLDVAMMLLVTLAVAGVAVGAHHGLLGRWLSERDVFIGIVLMVAFTYISWRWFDLRWWGHLGFAVVPTAAWILLRGRVGGGGLWAFAVIGAWTFGFEMVARRLGLRLEGDDD